MSHRIRAVLILSTALATVLAATAFAGDFVTIELPRQPVSIVTASGVDQPASAPQALVAPEKSEPLAVPTSPASPADPSAAQTGATGMTTTADAPAEPAPVHETVTPQPAPAAVAAELPPPEAKPQADASTPASLAAVPPSAAPAPPIASAPALVRPEPTAVTAVVPAIDSSQPAGSASAPQKTPVDAVAPPAVAAPPIVVAVPAAAATAAALPPVAAQIAAGPTDETVAASLKAEIDARFLGKAANDKALGTEEKKSRSAIIAFYTGRAYQPLFVDHAGWTAPAHQAIERLSKAEEDGLRAADYPVPVLAPEVTADALVKAELQLVQSAMKFARQAQAGRFDPSRLGELVTAKPTIPDPDSVLKTLATSANVADALESYNPPQQGYKRLKAKLAELLDGKPMAPIARVPDGPTIRPGQKDTRIAVLRNRLGVTGTLTADDATLYDDSLVEAVKTFQKTRGLKPSGIIGQQTVEAVNDAGPGNDTRAADIIANMERWRWLPRDLGDLYVIVNIPDFSLTVVRDGVVTHKAKAIVGRVANPTPVFSNTMTHIIVNPYWNVPYSIVQKEYLAKAQETKGEALQRGNFEVEVGNQVVEPTSVDWTKVSASQIHLRQRPGEGNALGNIKFMFPNQHSVYIHDTSSRGLFVQSYRSLSHGCVRVQDPFSFADALLSEEPTGITGAKLKSMIGGGEKYLWLKKTIPVHIAYFTDFVDDTGVLQTRPDLYGHNARTKQLLGL